eukprot:313648_1
MGSVTRMSIMCSIVLISILFKISTASVSYHVVESDTPSQPISWTNIKDKVTDRFASCRNNEEYNALVHFLKKLDNDVEYFIGIKIVNQEFKTADGHHTIVVTNDMAKLHTLVPQPGRTYYLYWTKNRFVMSSHHMTFDGAQGIQEYRDSVLTTFKYFAWIISEGTEGITLKDSVLGLQAHGPDSNVFDLLTADGSPKTVIVSSTHETCFVTFEDDIKNGIKANVKKWGYSQDLIKVNGRATIPGEQIRRCCGRSTDNSVVKDVEMWIRPVDENKKILFLAANDLSGNKAQIAKKVYGEFDKFSEFQWNNIARATNNHEYVFNLFKFKFVHQADFVDDVDDIYNDELKPHKGLVIINKEPAWLKNEYYKNTDNKYNEFIHSRNLQRFFRPISKSFWKSFGHPKANIETWKLQVGHRVLNVIDLFTRKEDFSQPRQFYAYNFQMSQADLQSKYSDGNIKLKQFSDVNPVGNNLNDNSQPITQHKELLLYPSGHTVDVTMAQDIDLTMKKKQPKTVIIEIDPFRLSTFNNNDFNEHGGLNVDIYQAIRTAIHNTFTNTIVYADIPALPYFAWMFEDSGMHKVAFKRSANGDMVPQDIYPPVEHYHWIGLNVRNHLMMHVILKVMDQNPTWIQIGGNHYELQVQPTNNYPYQMLHLLTNEYNSLSIPLRFTSDDKISLRFDIKPYHQSEHTFRAIRPFNNDYYIGQKNEHVLINHFVSPYMLQLLSFLAILVCLVLVGIAYVCICIVGFILAYKNVDSIKSTIRYQESYS